MEQLQAESQTGQCLRAISRGAPLTATSGARRSTPLTLTLTLAGTSTPLETWSSLVVLCEAWSTVFAGALCLEEDFLFHQIIDSLDPWSPFSTRTAGDHLENYPDDDLSLAKLNPWPDKFSTNNVGGICDQYHVHKMLHICLST